MNGQKAYVEDGEFVYEDEQGDFIISFSPQWNMAYLYDDEGDEKDITPFFPSIPTLEEFEKAAKDYCDAQCGKIPYQLYRPEKLKEINQREAVRMLNEVPLEKQLTIN